MAAERKGRWPAWVDLAARAVGWAALFLGLAWSAGELARTRLPWRHMEDPRTRLLSSARHDGSRIVLLGDSIFASYYVDREAQALWRQIEARQGRSVFPGALNSARPADFPNEARVVAASWPRGTVVVVDVPPSKLLRATVSPGERWRPELGRWVWLPPHASSPVERLEHGLRFLAGRPLLFWSVLLYLRDNPPEVSEAFYDRVWNEPGTTFAAERFAGFREELAAEKPGPPALQPTDWAETMLEVNAEAGFRTLVVVTPANRDLVTTWMPTAKEAEALLGTLDGARAAFARRLRARGAEVLDLDGVVPSRCFADLFHTNACGEAILADAVDARIRRLGW